MSFAQYARFLFVGAIVGIITVGARELIGRVLVADTRQAYSASVILAYVIGITLSFMLNNRFTFSNSSGYERSWKIFLQFAGIAIIGLLTVWLLSLALRYGLRLDEFVGCWARLLSF